MERRGFTFSECESLLGNKSDWKMIVHGGMMLGMCQEINKIRSILLSRISGEAIVSCVVVERLSMT